MKRSVFLANLRDSLNESEVGHYSYSDMAKFFLEFAEGQGMLPPIVSKPERCLCSMRSTCQDCSPELYKTPWEPED